MCGIFGYVGKEGAVKLCLKGLKRLEYRGYDSSGIACVSESQIVHTKRVGKVAVLEKAMAGNMLPTGTAIAHTRWATHGVPSTANAHPHLDTAESLAVVHNGIIENHDALRQALQDKGVVFTSQTDTEVIAQLVADLYKGDLLGAIHEAMPLMQGAIAIAVTHKDHPDEVIVAARHSPLAIGVGEDETFISSDTNAFADHTGNVIFLHDGEVARVSAKGVELYDAAGQSVERDTEAVGNGLEEATKNGYDHYMLKEIFEQPQTIRNALISRCADDYGTAQFDELSLDVNELRGVHRILILACGTSWHAGFIAAYLIEEMARIPVQCEISSEFRYKNPIVEEGTLVLAISQSGETADTLAAVRELKAKGAKIIAICNVQGSTLTREADSTLMLRAGPEVGVASTKAFTSNLVVLSLFGLMMARMRHLDKQEGQHFLNALQQMPALAQQVLDNHEQIAAMAKKYAHFENFHFIGRSYMYPTSLEAALKLKEISYTNATGYPAGELKHGPIALVDEGCATIACCANQLTLEKIRSNLMEVQARRGPILAIVPEGVTLPADDTITVPAAPDSLAAIPTSITLQLFAYYIAKERGTEIDQPRNLAKSVTVE